jgi:hypothetical protein
MGPDEDFEEHDSRLIILSDKRFDSMPQGNRSTIERLQIVNPETEEGSCAYSIQWRRNRIGGN